MIEVDSLFDDSHLHVNDEESTASNINRAIVRLHREFNISTHSCYLSRPSCRFNAVKASSRYFSVKKLDSTRRSIWGKQHSRDGEMDHTSYWVLQVSYSGVLGVWYLAVVVQ